MKTNFTLPSYNYNLILSTKELELIAKGETLAIRPERCESTFSSLDGTKWNNDGHQLLMRKDDCIADRHIQFLTVSVDRKEIKEIKMEEYKFRMIKEYQELKEKYEKLHKMIIKHDAGTLEFTLNCPIDLLKEQRYHMSAYMQILEIRAEIGKVDLNREV